MLKNGFSLTQDANRTYNIEIVTADLAGNVALHQKALVTDLITVTENVEPNQYALQLYPNPAKETVIVELQSPKPQKVAIALYNLQGQIMREITHNMTQNIDKVLLGINQLPNGVYVIQAIFADGQTMSLKLLIDR